MSAPSRPADTSSVLRLEILGPLRVWRGGVELDTGPRQQAYILALLLARVGRPVSTSELVDLMWGEDAPASAVNVVQKYVGTLRRLLEPALPVRGTGAYLFRRGNGYLFEPGPGMLDLAVFRGLVRAAVAEPRAEAALGRYVEALALWRGPAGAGFAYGPDAVPIFAGLNGEFLAACEAAAELAVSLGRPEQVLPPLELAAEMAPLHEPVQAGLVSVLAAAGQQARALAVFRSVRMRLSEELGIDPGPALEDAHRRVMNQASTAEPEAVDHPATGGLVGRAEELSVLRQVVAPALAGGAALGVVEGEPGVGKTRLLEEVAAEAARSGAFVVWTSCIEGEGTPSMWPWVQAIGAVLQGMARLTRERWLAGEVGRLVEPRGYINAAPVLPDSGTRFRLFEQIVAVIGQVSSQRPLVLVIDDLQWADVASLQMFGHLAARLPTGTVVVGALRDRAPVPGSELSRVLAAASRVPHHRRLRLSPLSVAEVTELVRQETGKDPGAAAARTIHARTAGNPFFVRELSRLLADGGSLSDDAVARAGVPSTVLDVVRDRMADLGDEARDLLQIAALIGREVSLGLLAGVAVLDIESCLERVEPVQALGLLEFVPDDPYTFRFAHDLIRESIIETTPARRVSRLHLRIADTLERDYSHGEAFAERLAFHLWSAGPLAGPARTAGALVGAGRRAMAKAALEAAERQLRSAAQVARAAGLAELELSALAQLTAVVGMRSMYASATLTLLERAEHLARGLGWEREATDFLYSRWAAHAQGLELDRSGPLARRLLDQGEASSDPVIREYGLHAWGIHQWATGNIGEAYRYLSRSDRSLSRREEAPLRHDLQLLMSGMLAETTALYGDIDAAQSIIDTLEAAAGDDPYVTTIWATFAVRIAVLIGDPDQALRAAQRGIAVDPEFSFAFLGTYQRLARCWALAMTGTEPDQAAAEARQLIATMLLDPPRACVATWHGLLAEMRLTAGALDEAAAALDRADHLLDAYGQRYPEGLILLLRARLLHARGEPGPVVRAAALKARALSIEREAHLFRRRADEFLAQLAD
jgi:DNA-binding SARP family transcriptional activator/tetratricopeptide (TPR) repeat protein